MKESWLGCRDEPNISVAERRASTQFNTRGCTACPSNFYVNCSQLYGPEWTNGNNISEGTGCKMQCIRSNYLNKNTSCCYGREDSNPNYTCDPSLVPGNPKCTSALVEWCNDPNNIDTTYCTQDKSTYDPIMAKYCTPDNISSDVRCRNWVMQGNQRGNIDVLMESFCSKYPLDTLCCYMTSKIPCPNKFDQRCVGVAAYETSSMISTACPPILNCNQQINIDPKSRQYLIGTNIELSCGQRTTTNDSSSSSDSKNNNNVSTDLRLNDIYAGGAIIGLLAIIVGVVMID